MLRFLKREGNSSTNCVMRMMMENIVLSFANRQLLSNSAITDHVELGMGETAKLSARRHCHILHG